MDALRNCWGVGRSVRALGISVSHLFLHVVENVVREAQLFPDLGHDHGSFRRRGRWLATSSSLGEIGGSVWRNDLATDHFLGYRVAQL